MGGGVVLESGTHNELLADAEGAYARLVAAQRLRDAREKQVQGDGDSDTAASDEADDLEKQAAEEVPLGRTNTRKSGRSLASEILEQRNKEKASGQKDYSMPYLFMRMGRINRESWKKYLIAAIAAARTFLYSIIFMCNANTFQQ